MPFKLPEYEMAAYEVDVKVAYKLDELTPFYRGEVLKEVKRWEDEQRSKLEERLGGRLPSCVGPYWQEWQT